ncbi:MAG: dipeptide/oligopeptide/nickel ABC transporter permease/ATP-binding protein [Acidimicrobiales bacterium]
MSAIEAVADAATITGAVDAAQAPGFWRRLLRRPLAVACMLFLLGMIVVAIVAPILLPAVSHQGVGDLLHVRAGPSGKHLLGTDTVGRDVLDRLLYGTRLTMLGVAEVVIVATLLGLPLGLAAGYLGGWVDRIAGWWVDFTFSIPTLIIIIVVIAIFPRNLLAAMVTYGILTAPAIVRTVRAATLPVREELYIAAARVSGLSRPYIIGRHVLPRVAGVVTVQTALVAAGSVGITAGLSFLGLLDPNIPTWGGMIQDGMTVLQLDPWLLWPPAIAIGLTTLAFTLIGDSVRDATAESWSAPPRRARTRPLHRDQHSPAHDTAHALLSVEHLTVALPSPAGPVPVVEDLCFQVDEGETLGIVGESGCGKTMTAKAILDLLPGGGRIEGGSIFYRGRDLALLSERELRRVRGKEIALISQEPMVSLTPTFRVGWQIAEVVRRHHRCSRGEAKRRTIELLRTVRLPEPELVARRYPHELSGGMAQRVAIARALAGDPALLIADEPTTALDVTIQAEILDLLRELQSERKMAVLLITHDWGVISDLADRVIVMYAGEVVEQGALIPVVREPLHPYTEALLSANPHHAPDADMLPTIPGSVPKPGAWPQGCHFHPRCRYATAACQQAPIPIARPQQDRETRCIHYDRLGTLDVGLSE